MMTPTQTKVYQEAFQAFVTKRKLDIEYDNWGPEDMQAWDVKVEALREKGVLPR